MVCFLGAAEDLTFCPGLGRAAGLADGGVELAAGHAAEMLGGLLRLTWGAVWAVHLSVHKRSGERIHVLKLGATAKTSFTCQEILPSTISFLQKAEVINFGELFLIHLMIGELSWHLPICDILELLQEVLPDSLVLDLRAGA